MTGKHPADMCQNLKDGKKSCHGCGGHSDASTDANELVSEITKRVIEQLGLK